MSWLKNKRAAPLLIIIAIFLTIVFVYLFNTSQDLVQNFNERFEQPSPTHPFGTDDLGRDLFLRVLKGGMWSLTSAILSALGAASIALICGSFAGMLGGLTEKFFLKATEVWSSVPSFLLLLVLKVFFDSIQWFSETPFGTVAVLSIALSLEGWVGLGRFVRVQVLQIKAYAFVEMSQAMGAKSLVIYLKHILPQFSMNLLILSLLQIPHFILLESFLSFLGLGFKPPFSSWGTLISNGFEMMDSYPHLLIFPSLAMVFSFVFLLTLGKLFRQSSEPLKGYSHLQKLD